MKQRKKLNVTRVNDSRKLGVSRKFRTFGLETTFQENEISLLGKKGPILKEKSVKTRIKP
jgi:hypothetical protein